MPEVVKSSLRVKRRVVITGIGTGAVLATSPSSTPLASELGAGTVLESGAGVDDGSVGMGLQDWGVEGGCEGGKRADSSDTESESASRCANAVWK